MNDFEAKHIKEAAKYLTNKLEILREEKKPHAYILEAKKERNLWSFLRSFFRF